MKRVGAICLIAGCFVILALEAPAAVSTVLQDLDGPYADWESGVDVGATRLASPDS